MQFLLATVALELIAAIAFLAGRLVFRRTRSVALGVLTGLVLALAPWWDAVPGVFAYVTQVRADGGTRVIQTTESRDTLHHLDTPLRDAQTAIKSCMADHLCSGSLRDRRRAVELLLGPETGPITGVVHVSIVTGPDPRCDRIAEFNQTRIIASWALADNECFAIEESVAPGSRFEVRTENSDRGRLTYTLDRTRESVVERDAKRTLAERIDYQFSTWPDAPWPALRLHLAPPPLDISSVLTVPMMLPMRVPK